MATDPPFDLKSFIRDVPDFPQPGILFRDITPLLHALARAPNVTPAMEAGFGPRAFGMLTARNGRSRDRS